MSLRYYHDAARQTVIAMPAEPTVYEKKDRHGRCAEWVVQSEQRITRADNVRIPNSHRWRHAVRLPLQEVYDAMRDSRKKAVEFFEHAHLPNLPEIGADEYERLRQEYQSQADGNST